MNYTSFLIEALNDLIKVNSDRVVGYTEASKEMDKTDALLKESCLQMAQESKKNIADLKSQIKKINNKLPTSNEGNGKVFKLWNEVMEADAQNNRKPSFASCVCSEDAVQKMYEDVLLTYTFMPAELRLLIMQQKKNIGYSKKAIMHHLNVSKAVA